MIFLINQANLELIAQQ